MYHIQGWEWGKEKTAENLCWSFDGGGADRAGEGMGGLAPSHDRSLSNLALKVVHSGGFENVNLLEGHGCKATLSAT